MSKLYVFGIGGTGSRVLKSLIMLLSSGVKIEAEEIVPIIIDPDGSSGDLTHTIDVIRTYNAIHSQIKPTSKSRNKFFTTKINLGILPEIVFKVDNTQNMKFGEFIGMSLMRNSEGKENPNYALSSLLFSKKNLDSDMKVGFKGNPNIGSVVLNQFQDSPQFKQIASSFQQNDRIFVISSIFGGTGASGFPLLVKNLREIDPAIGGSGFVKNAVIGAITVLPYFGVESDGNSEIDSSTFIVKAKAALTYYERNLNETNVLYYIGDNLHKQYPNVEGGPQQKNKAHFVEYAAALSIVDFMSIPEEKIGYDN